MAQLEGPHPPGDYPVVVVGSGPGALQTSYFLTRLGVEHALLSSDDRPGGMFRRFPIFQRLISWSKPYSPSERGTRAYQRYDWNSLLAEERENQALVPESMDGTSYFPSRSEMEAGVVAFTEKTGTTVRYGCTWESTERTDDGFVLTTSDGEYRCRVAILAVGMAQPWKPAIPGLEHVPHYVETREPKDYAGRSVFIIGKRNSGFEIADGLLPWARQLVLASPRPAHLSVMTRSLAGARARYLQPYEDHILGGGNFVVDAAIERVDRTSDGFRVHARGTTTPGDQVFEVDDVIAATGFEVPIRDLGKLGLATVMQGRLPALTPYWESASVPGLYFSGTIMQGAPGLKKYGIPGSSGAVHGFRNNARLLARHVAEKHFSAELPRPVVSPDALVDLLLEEATHAPELWNQVSYLAAGLSLVNGEWRNDGIVPLAHFVDSGPLHGVAIAVETDPSGDIHPAVYVRRDGEVEEHLLRSSPTHDYLGAEHRRELRSILSTIRD